MERELKPMNDPTARLDLMELRCTSYMYKVPYCINHGAMLRVSKSGVWRCSVKECKAGGLYV